MIAGAGSKAHDARRDQQGPLPVAGGFNAQVDKEMTTFTGSIHKDNWTRFVTVALPMLLDPGFREEDFKRYKDAQLNALKQDLTRTTRRSSARSGCRRTSSPARPTATRSWARSRESSRSRSTT